MRFSIRDLFLVTMIVAILMAWWVDKRRQAVRDEKTRERIQGLETAIEQGKKRERAAHDREAKLSDDLWQRKHHPHQMENRRFFPPELP